jgi:iron complex outermembrane recepter protein
VATVFETPTTTELANRPDGAGGFNPELEPQHARSVEVGARGDLGAQTTYQLAVYRSHIRNALIPFQVPEAQGRDFFRNAGTAVHQGAEAALGVALLPRLSATLAYAYTDAVFDDYTVRGVAFDGNHVPGVAPHRWTGGLNYRREGGLFTGVEGVRVSSIPVDDANTDVSPAYALVNARIGHTGVRLGRTELAPFVGLNNLLDQEYNAAVTINAFGGRFFEPGPGRSLYFGMSVRGGVE